MHDSLHYHLQDISQAAQTLLQRSGGRPIWAFSGEIGAGKTTLIKALCQQLGAPQTVSSPTFSLVNEYAATDGTPFYHMDLYRLDDLEEALDIGIEEYLDSGRRCLIEWPELIEPLLPEDTFRIKLEIADDCHRKILFL